MPSDNYERDFDDVGKLRFPGRWDPRLLQNIDDAGDGYPGLQKAVRNWVKYWLHDGVMDQALDLNNQNLDNLNNLDVDGNITLSVAATVDGVDISTLSLDSLPTATGADVDFNNHGANNIDNFDERIYYVSTDAELDNAIADITTNTCAGRIIITDSLTNVQATINAASSSFIIEGNGENTILTNDGSNTIFNITNCKSLVVRDLRANCFTTGDAFLVDEVNNNPVFFERIHVSGENTNTSTAFRLNSKKITVKNCIINSMYHGIYFDSDSHESLASENELYDCKFTGIFCSAPDHIRIIGNYIHDTDFAASSNLGAISIQSGSEECLISSNMVENIINSGTGTAYGINIGSGTTENTVLSNVARNCATNFNDSGTNTFGDNTLNNFA